MVHNYLYTVKDLEKNILIKVVEYSMRTKSNLKKLLEHRNMSLYRLQQLTKISYSNLHKYYSGEAKRFDNEVIAKICNALDCKIEELLIVEL